MLRLLVGYLLAAAWFTRTTSDLAVAGGVMLDYGGLLAGVKPARGGTSWEGKVTVFNTVRDAVLATGADASLIFVPPAFAADAILEAADAGVAVIVCISE